MVQKDGCGITDQSAQVLIKDGDLLKPVGDLCNHDINGSKVSSAYGFKLGQRTLQMIITATEVTRVTPEDDSGKALVEAKYRLRWQGIAG